MRYTVHESSAGSLKKWPYRRVAVLRVLDDAFTPSAIRDIAGRVEVVRVWEKLPARGKGPGSALVQARAAAGALAAELTAAEAERLQAEAARLQAEAAALLVEGAEVGAGRGAA